MIRMSAMVAAGVVMQLLLLGLWSATSAQEAKIVGEYSCHGTQAGDKTYDITLAVVPMVDAYYLAWLHDGKQAYEGIALAMDGYLSAISVGHNGVNLVASAVVYKVSPNRLDGAWTGGDGHVYHEVCSRNRGNL